MLAISKIRRAFKPKREKPRALPTSETPIEITVGHGVRVRLNQIDGTWDVLREQEDGTFIAVNHAEMQHLRGHIVELEEENRLLRVKLEVLLDMLSRATLDNKLLNAGLARLKKEKGEIRTKRKQRTEQ